MLTTFQYALERSIDQKDNPTSIIYIYEMHACLVCVYFVCLDEIDIGPCCFFPKYIVHKFSICI